MIVPGSIFGTVIGRAFSAGTSIFDFLTAVSFPATPLEDVVVELESLEDDVAEDCA